MAVADIAALGLSVDSSQVEKGTVSLGKFSGAARQAEAAANNLAGETRAASGASVSMAGASARVVSGLNSEKVAAAGATAALRAHAVAANQNAISAGAVRANVGNLAAQFQDVGVSALSGANGMTVALQQGTQISAVLGPLGAAGAVQALGGALAAVFSPFSLLVITITALVAVGLQMIDWAKTSAWALNALASIIPQVADEAAIAGAALAIAFAPAILSSVYSLTVAIGTGLVGALRAAALAAAANPYVALALAFAAIVTAVYVYRDEVAQAIGIDVVGIVKNAANTIIGVMVGAYDAIMATWRVFPAAMADIGYQAADKFVRAIQTMAREAIATANGAIASLNGALRGAGIELPSLPSPVSALPPSMDGISNPYAGSAAGAGSSAAAAFQAAQGRDYIGAIGSSIAAGARTASDALSDLSAKMGAVGEEAETAGRKGGGAGKAVKDAASGAADAWKGLRGVTKEAGDAMSGAKDVVKGFVSDLRSGLKNGEGFWKSFASAASNALDKIIDKMLNTAIDSLFSAGMSGGGGGLFGALGSIFGGFFADGGTLGAGKWGIAGENGPEIIKGPAQVIPSHQMPRDRSAVVDPQKVEVSARVFVDDNGNWQAKVEGIAARSASRTVDDYDRTRAPGTAVNAVQEYQRRAV